MNQIPEDLIARLKDAVSLSALMRQDGVSFVADKCGGSPRRTTHCPFPDHDDSTPSFSCDDDKGFYKCWGCERSGDAISWLTDFRGLSFVEALRILATESGSTSELRRALEPEGSAEGSRAYEVNAEVARYFAYKLSQDDDALRYLHERGVTDDDISKFQLGLAPERRHRDYLTHATGQMKVTESELAELGLLSQRDGRSFAFFHERIMFPIRNLRGQVVGFSGRLYRAGASGPKYLNTRRTEWFDKSALLYGAEHLKPGRAVLVVEGQLDVIALLRIGVPAVAALGTSLSHSQASWLARTFEQVVLCFDDDDAGERAWRSEKLAQAWLGVATPRTQARVLQLGAGQDPDAMVASGATVDTFRKAVAQAPDYLSLAVECLLEGVEDLTLSERAERVERASSWLALVENKALRAVLMHELCGRLGVHATSVAPMVDWHRGSVAA